MKDTIITAKQKKREIYFFLGAIGIMFCVNIYSIIRYNTPWKELWTQLPWVLIWACVLWALWLILRWVFWGIMKLFRKKA